MNHTYQIAKVQNQLLNDNNYIQEYTLDNIQKTLWRNYIKVEIKGYYYICNLQISENSFGKTLVDFF